MNQEEKRLEESRLGTQLWRKWGPYLSERQWGTVREDYSPNGTAWDYFSHDHARSRAYRWGEDGIAGVSDDQQRLCFALALWNGKDPIIKERLFGLTGSEGNHGEDVKEYAFYLDNTPTHAYMKYLYKYPQNAYPYEELVKVNRERTRKDFEYELLDTGIFDDDRYFDVFVEYAKNSPDDLLIQITIANRGPERSSLHLLPHLWFRNTWSWSPGMPKPKIEIDGGKLKASHPDLGTYWLYSEKSDAFLFTENETNKERLFHVSNDSPYVKDAFHEYVVSGLTSAVNPSREGTKSSLYYKLEVPARATTVVKLRLSSQNDMKDPLGVGFNGIFASRKQEADAFYNEVTPFPLPEDMRNVQRQAFAGLLWNKQYYHYNVDKWLKGDPSGPPPPENRKKGRNRDWKILDACLLYTSRCV